MIMKNIQTFKTFSKNEAWNSFLRRPDTKDAARDQMSSMGYSNTGTDNLGKKESEEYIMHGGRKFYKDQIEYASYDDMGQIPRIEGDKLIIANPAWSE